MVTAMEWEVCGTCGAETGCDCRPLRPAGWRFSLDDEQAVVTRLREVWRDWKVSDLSPAAVETLTRLAAHAVGLGVDDLTADEAAWVRDTIDDVVSPGPI